MILESLKKQKAKIMEYENLKGKNNLSLASPLYAKDLDESFCVIDMRYPQDYEMIHIKDSLNLNNPYDIYEHIKHHPQKNVCLCAIRVIWQAFWEVNLSRRVWRMFISMMMNFTP